MSKYQVLARKYRPQKFTDVVSQKAIVTTLKNAIRMQRTAHAYLFCGSRGTGKTTLARLFAKALNCAHLSEEIEPCNECPSCRDIALGHAIDVLEIDGASHRGIEDIRQINETIGFTPATGKYKIYLIDEVHMLTKEAFNALLKTLEEPPSHVKFFFATTEPHKIPATILSRCQRFNLGRIPLEKMCEKLSEIAKDFAVSVETEALEMIAEFGEGSLRDALSLFDQILSFEKQTITLSTVIEVLGLLPRDMLFAIDEAGANKDLTAPFRMAGGIFSSGKNLSYFLEELTAHFRMLFLVKNGIHPTGRDQERYRKNATLYRTEQLARILEMLVDAQQTLKYAPSERTALEILLLRIIRSHQQISLDNLVERLISLEQRLSVSEDPLPKPEELPPTPKKSPPTPAIAKRPEHVPLKEQSRFDTVMRFAAKELNGSLKKE